MARRILSLSTLSLSTSFPTDLHSSSRHPKVRRWDGATRESVEWNFLRRDPELWFPEGDTLVYLYREGHSFRGPAFRVPSAGIVASGCMSLLEQHYSHDATEPANSETSIDDGQFFSNPSRVSMHEIYLPAPESLLGEKAYAYHIATRNLFAWMFEKPLVGVSLGLALVDLVERLTAITGRRVMSLGAVIKYMDEQAYSDCSKNPDQALGVLCFAERYRQVDLWADSFPHCVGMADLLQKTQGLDAISQASRRLITHARIEMDLRLESARFVLATFNIFPSGAFCTLPGAKFLNFDKLRSFLTAYHNRKYDKWPTPLASRSSLFYQRQRYKEMHLEFRSLLEYLVDHSVTESSSVALDNEDLITLAELQEFDRKNHYKPLPYRLPLLPDCASLPENRLLSLRVSKFRALFPLSKTAKPAVRMKVAESSIRASNGGSSSSNLSPLVKAYREFEVECILDANQSIPYADMRRLNWIVLYSILQTLISVTTLPNGVHTNDDITYPLCCDVPRIPKPITSQPREARVSFGSPRPNSKAIPNRRSSLRKQDNETFRPFMYAPLRRSNSIALQSISGPDTKYQENNHRALQISGNRIPNYVEINIPDYGNGLGVRRMSTLSHSDSSSSTMEMPELSFCDSSTTSENDGSLSPSSIFSGESYNVRSKDQGKGIAVGNRIVGLRGRSKEVS